MEIIRRSATAKRMLYTIDPEPYEMKPLKGRVAIADSETDPFLEGRIVQPFTCGYYFPDTEEYFDFWGADCFDQMFDHIEENYGDEEIVFFGHNWGNFDVYFTTHKFDEGMKPFIKNGRLSRVTCRGKEFRDSYDMIPVALGNALSSEDGGKIEINYAKLEREYTHGQIYKTESNYDPEAAFSEYISRAHAFKWMDCNTSYAPRDFYRDEILHYQRQDCVALGKLVVEWLAMFGDRMSMASVALPMLRHYHGFETMSEHIDNDLRPYYFGGRCQPFETGVIRGSFKAFDINSSYPDVMRRVMHPISDMPMYEKRITSKTHFAHIKAWSNGALPVRADDGGLNFPVGVGDFYACIHEIKAGLETGTLKVLHVYSSMYFQAETTFDAFIDEFYRLRMEAGAAEDEIKKLFYKLVMNSSYGKFAQDPRKYERWWFDPPSIPMPVYCPSCNALDKSGSREWIKCARCIAGESDPYGWYLHTEREGSLLYARPQALRGGRGFFNVATAASITSAARASLLYAINGCIRPIYSDTDSLICEDLQPDPTGRIILDAKALGAWKKEFVCDEVCIGGKKLYAAFSGGIEVKKASKGVRLTAQEIRRICEGETIEYRSPVPKMSLFRDLEASVRVNDMVTATFINRKISRTDMERTTGNVIQRRFVGV